MGRDLFVAAQRHPWLVAAAAVFAVGKLPSIVGGPAFQWSETTAPLAVLATTLAAHAVGNAPSWSARLSALVLGNLSAATHYSKWGREFELRDADEMLTFVALSSAAWAVAVLLPRRAASYAIGPAAVLAGWFVLGSPGLDRPWDSVGLLALPLAVAAIVASEAPLRRWVLGAAVFGAVVGLAACWVGDIHLEPGLEDYYEVPGAHALAGILIALVGGLCRRARRVTAVPPDHPSIADFPSRPSK